MIKALVTNSEVYLYASNLRLMTTFRSELDQHLTDFKASYNTLMALLSIYPQDLIEITGVCGEWTPKQVLMHLAGWLREACRRFERFPRGTGDMQYNADVFNRVSLRQREGDDWDRIIAEINESLGEIQRLILRLEEGTLSLHQPRYIEWLVDLNQECQMHTRQLYDFAQAAPEPRNAKSGSLEQPED